LLILMMLSIFSSIGFADGYGTATLTCAQGYQKACSSSSEGGGCTCVKTPILGYGSIAPASNPAVSVRPKPTVPVSLGTQLTGQLLPILMGPYDDGKVSQLRNEGLGKVVITRNDSGISKETYSNGTGSVKAVVTRDPGTGTVKQISIGGHSSQGAFSSVWSPKNNSVTHTTAPTLTSPNKTIQTISRGTCGFNRNPDGLSARNTTETAAVDNICLAINAIAEIEAAASPTSIAGTKGTLAPEESSKNIQPTAASRAPASESASGAGTVK
jgi:hypothetical protein